MDSDGNRPHKRRAAQACKSCRTRKVRCDLVTTGIPPGCTNCRLDGIECQLTGNKRRRTIHLPQEGGIAASSNGETGTVEPSHPNGYQLSKQVPIEISTPQNSSGVPCPAPVEGLESPAVADGSDYAPASPAQHSTETNLPLYIQNLPTTVSPEDLEYLATKSAFILPSKDFLNLCLCRYIEFVHPVLPLLDLNDTLMSIDDETGGSGRISLLLYFAIIYAALPFTEIEQVRAAGFQSKLEARTTVYKKVKVLYDLIEDMDQLVLVQTSLLMSTPHGSMDAVRDAWYWIGLAISHAQAVGLHLDIGPADIDDPRRKWRRRLWWCCFIREHVVAMGLGRPSRITYYNVAMLSIGDFNWGKLPDAVRSIPLQCAVARDVDRQQKLAAITVEKAKLCVYIRRAVRVMCSIRDGNSSKMPNNALSDALRESAFCAKDLEHWAATLPIEASYDMESPTAFLLDDRCLILARATLHMLFYDAVCVLNRPRALALRSSSNNTDPNQPPQDEPRRQIRWAARDLVRINSGLYESGLLSYVDATGVANVVAAMVVYLLDAKSSDSNVRQTAVRGLHQCIDFLRVLKDTYGSAIHAFRFLQATVQSEDFPTLEHQVNKGSEQVSQSSVQRTLQVSVDFPPAAASEATAQNGAAISVAGLGGATSLAAEGEQLAPDSLSEDYLMDYLRNEGGYMANFGSLGLSMAFQDSFGAENHGCAFDHQVWQGDTPS